MKERKNKQREKKIYLKKIIIIQQIIFYSAALNWCIPDKLFGLAESCRHYC